MCSGISESTRTSFGTTPRTIRPRSQPVPSSVAIATSRFPSVAERPQVRISGFHCLSRAKQSSVCTPRFEPISSCHSSAITSRSEPKISLASSRASKSARLSGVVTNAVGSRFFWRARTAAFVSPVLCSRRQGIFMPWRAIRSEFSVSATSARNGVIHRTRNGGSISPSPCIHSIRGPIHAASVLPVPVAA